MIAEVRYNTPEHKLYVQFHDGNVYRYENVSLSKYVWFRGADSAGKFFTSKIKPFYPATRVPTGFPRAVAIPKPVAAAQQ